MCKVLMIAGIKTGKLSKAQKLAQEMTKVISRAPNNDGVGYAAITSKGAIYGEKWLEKDDAFKVHQSKEDKIANLMATFFKEAAKFKKEPFNRIYENFGDMSAENIADTRAIILHTRNATTGSKHIINTHPFVELGAEGIPDTALIHNGNISNHDTLTKKYSQCDSEVILHEYIGNVMWFNPWGGIEMLAKTLVGQYTCGVLSSAPFEDGTVQPVLDIFKSNKSLHVGWVPDLETMVYSTEANDLEEGVKNAGMTIEHIMEIQDGFFLRLDAITGEKLEEPIKFELSALNPHQHRHWQNSNNTPNTGSNSGGATVYPYRQQSALGPAATLPVSEAAVQGRVAEEETVDDIAKNFEKNHADIFTHKYHDVDGISEVERQYLEAIEGKGDVDFKALHLVKVALNL